MENSSLKIKTIDITYIAIFAALIVICSWISIPTQPPFTLQTFAVFCALGLLGAKKGTASVLVFLLLGAIGLPVFSGFKGGIGAILGATGGYMVGFIFMGIIYRIGEVLGKGKNVVNIIAMVIGLFVCYAFGTVWFMVVYTKNTGAIGFGKAFSLCVLPFIIPDIVKLILADILIVKLRKALRIGGTSL